MIISQSLARRMFPNEDAVNRHLTWTDPIMKFIDVSPTPRRIVGVAADIDDRNIVPGPALNIYHPIDQELDDFMCARAEQSLEEVVGMYLVMKNATISTAESCTGGLLMSRLTDVRPLRPTPRRPRAAGCRGPGAGRRRGRASRR